MAWIGAAIAAAGGLVANEQRANSAESLTSEQMQWQERMRASAYPATVQSMKDAGLNPMLAYKQGALPTGNYTPIQPIVENIGAAADTGYQQTASAHQAQQQTEQIKQEMTAFETKLRKLDYETDVAHTASYRASAEWNYTRQNVENEALQLATKAILMKLEVPEATATAAMYSEDFGKAVPYVREAIKAFAGATGGAKALGQGLKIPRR